MDGTRPLVAADARRLAFTHESPEALPRNNHPELPDGAAEPGLAVGCRAGDDGGMVGDEAARIRTLQAEVVEVEAAEGDASMAEARLRALDGIPRLPA